MAFSTGLLYVGYPYLRNWFSKKKITFIAGAIFAILLFTISVFVKEESSAGRAFIWQNSMQLLKNNLLTGVGFGKFNPAYNHLQANYFSTHSITDGIALRLLMNGYIFG